MKVYIVGEKCPTFQHRSEQSQISASVCWQLAGVSFHSAVAKVRLLESNQLFSLRTRSQEPGPSERGTPTPPRQTYSFRSAAPLIPIRLKFVNPLHRRAELPVRDRTGEPQERCVLPAVGLLSGMRV